MSVLRLSSPLDGWCVALSEVPDPVFADGMAGDGVAIDPTGNVLHAPCDGEIVSMQGARHAVTVRSDEGIDVLMHVGVDTVALAGEGFELLVTGGQRVRAGEPLLRFDLDRLARGAKSLLTPVVLASQGLVRERAINRSLCVGDFLLEVDPVAAGAATTAIEKASEAQRRFRIPFDHGLHVRPAALIATALRPLAAEVVLRARGREANARSTVAMMALGAHCGDVVEASARGVDADAAIEALARLLAPEADETAAAPKADSAPLAPRRLEGVIASRGVGVGVAVQWVQPEIAVPERGGAPASESAALRNAVAFLKHHIEEASRTAEGAQRDVMSAHAELVDDPELAQRAQADIARGKSAAFAWRAATRSMIEVVAGLADRRMQERAADLRDLESQLIRVLAGQLPVAKRELPPHAIVLADDLPPSQLLALDRTRLAGLCMARGGATSHVSIIASAGAIPMLVAAGPSILDIAEGTRLVLDAEHGWLEVDPPAAEFAAAERAAVERAEEGIADLARAQQASVTRDGVRVVVNANLGSADEARAAVKSGAEGCGLLRTEFLFLERRSPPGEEEQAAEYARIAAALEGRPLSIRTLDAGGDKPIAYLPMPREDNPALGLRGLRAQLRRPDLLRAQLAAVMRVQPRGQCRVLLPMVNDLDDLRAARAIATECAAAAGVPVPSIGVMIETPAAALLAGQLAAEADFLSIGTNDLSQYTLAMDRGHAELAGKLDALHPAVLRMIDMVARAGRAAGKGVSVCGAMACDVDALPILIGLGVHELSAAAAAIPRLKRTVRLLDAGECRELARRALEQPNAAAVRDLAQAARSRARATAPTTGSG